MNLPATEETIGERLDRALALSVPGLSRHEAKTLIENGGVRIDGRRVSSKSHKVARGESITVDASALDDRSPDLKAALAQRMAEVMITQSAEGWSVLNKPDALPCTPYCFLDTLHLGERAEQLFRSSGLLFERLPEHGLVHRLDVGTSGVCLFARDLATYETFIAARNTPRLSRIYLARVDGQIPEHGTITSEIAHHPSRDDRMLTLPAERFRGEPQTARTTFRVLERTPNGAVVEVQIEGGRRHQIRVHLASIGHPIRGDALYGSTTHAPRFSLHAKTVTFMDARGARHEISAEPAPGF
jgi:23S rRNA pseudouridine1911/1915/1917 synthase